MQTRQIKELMVPISDYAIVHEDAYMDEAIRAIESENKRYGDAPYRHQSLVVLDDNRHVVGRLSQVDMMRALEPRYNDISKAPWRGQSVLSREVLKTLRESFQLWEQPMETMCHVMKKARVKDYMQNASEGEFVRETDTMAVAMHRIVIGRHHSLLVTRGKEIIGILRSTDLFNALYDMMNICGDL